MDVVILRFDYPRGRQKKAQSVFSVMQRPTPNSDRNREEPDAYTFPNEKQEELTEDEKEVAFQGYRKVSDQIFAGSARRRAAHARAN